MKQIYLLPCSWCGRRIPVESTRAGQQLRCECGATLEVPTMLAMRSLERVEPEERAVDLVSTWGVRQRMIVGGSVVFVLALAWIAYLGLSWPKRPPVDPQRVQEVYDTMKPVDTWQRWRDLRRGLPDRDEEYFSRLSSSRRWLGVALVVVAVGAGIVGGAFLVPKRLYRRRVRRARLPAQPSSDSSASPQADRSA